MLLVDLLNVVAALVFIYCIFSIPAQIIRRFRRKKQGLSVSPMLLVVRKLLKYWLVTAVIIIPVSCGIIFLSGLSGGHMYAEMVTRGVAGNILTSLLFGYVFMKANKENWSESGEQVK